ncbi:MAG: hypothetical protein JWR38_116 [Mucilaginibacter sp.]|nr:hypothetical protein [Mucilaginibacter sp.]
MKKLIQIILCQLLVVVPIVVFGQQKILPEDLKSLGPENTIIAQRVGIWEVSETVWASPGAAPVTTTGLVAERKMIGSMLQEFLIDSTKNEVKRTDLLTFNRIEGRWDYVSFDARDPLGLMPAWSSVKGDGKSIDFYFYPFALPGSGNVISGQMLRMDQTIRYLGSDQDVKDQYFTLADGTATRWLAHRYAYTRKGTKAAVLPAASENRKN